MIIKIFILLFIVLINNISFAANDKQFLIPGYGFIDIKDQDEQWLIPGYGFVDEEAGAAPPAGGGINQAIIISRREEFIEDNIKMPVDINSIVFIAQRYGIRGYCK